MKPHETLQLVHSDWLKFGVLLDGAARVRDTLIEFSLM